MVSHEVVVKLIARVAIISRVVRMEESTFKCTLMVVSRHQILAGYWEEASPPGPLHCTRWQLSSARVRGAGEWERVGDRECEPPRWEPSSFYKILRSDSIPFAIFTPLPHFTRAGLWDQKVGILRHKGGWLLHWGQQKRKTERAWVFEKIVEWLSQPPNHLYVSFYIR